jgi:hypothetical protein
MSTPLEWEASFALFYAPYGAFTLDVKWVLNENLGGILDDM